MDMVLHNEHSENDFGYLINGGNKFKNIVRDYRIARDMTLDQFLLYSCFDVNRFALPLKFWYNLNSISPDEFFVLPDELIDQIWFSNSGSKSNHRTNLL